MRTYYLLPEATAERVLTGIKPKCESRTSPGSNDQSCFNKQSTRSRHTRALELVPTSSSSSSSSSSRGCGRPVVSPRGATPSAPTGLNLSSRSVKKKKTSQKKKVVRSGIYKTTKLPSVSLRATRVREEKISPNPEINNLIPLYVKCINVLMLT